MHGLRPDGALMACYATFLLALFCDDLPRKKSKRRDMMLWPITSSFHINLLSKHDNFMQKTSF